MAGAILGSPMASDRQTEHGDHEEIFRRWLKNEEKMLLEGAEEHAYVKTPKAHKKTRDQTLQLSPDGSRDLNFVNNSASINFTKVGTLISSIIVSMYN